MEKQRSFSFKPTRLLVFSFTISTSVIFFTIFTIWVIKATPSFRQEIHLQYNKSSLSLGLRPITVQSLSSLSGNFSVTGEKDSTLIDSHYSSLENATGFASTSLFSGLQREEDGPGVLVDGESKSDGVDGNLTTLQESTPETISEKIEVPSSQMSEEKSTVATSSDNNGVSIREKVGLKRVKDCDLTKGRWVYDESYPLYTNDSCPFIDEGFNCKGNGRLDKNYMKWRWQPQDCEIPRFNATKMLELIRGKRLVFVGDSINRNQWESMLCMLMGAIKDPKRVYETHRRRITKEKGDYSIKFMDYRCTVEYYATHFLVHEAKARLGHKRIQTLRIDSIDRGTSRWRGADMLVFNTAHWWTHYKTKAGGGEWNSGGHCMEATQPLNWTPSISYSEKNIIVEEVIKKMKTPVTFLNITNLSGYRIDGHPSIYGGKSGKRSSSNIQDCSHWCLPGVPDTWNEILYFLLQSNRY
ncbi:protein trichome birefringence-like 6 [Quercus suber]|uniref:Protein trichome birefringence-like 6 n=1 Tax=Quercus suber TaxID=58331 RepID=A0AAW0J5P3_QUESU